MAKIGVFGLNLSPRSGGVYSLIEGLMIHAEFSKHEFVYFSEKRDSLPAYPSNVDFRERPRFIRRATQALMSLPRSELILGQRSLARMTISAICNISTRDLDSLDKIFWPHCFSPTPNINNSVVICHDMIHRHCASYFSRMALARRARTERTLQRCSTILCPSQSTADDLLSAYPDLERRVRRFSEAPAGIDLDGDRVSVEIDRLAGLYKGVPLFLFVGVDWPHKNHKLLIDAAVRLRRATTKPFYLIFVGHRRSSSIAREIEGAEASEFVHDVGSVEAPTLAAYYQLATAFTFPSLYEGFGIPLVEAMQCGLPIIATNGSCIPEICGDAAVLLPHNDPEAWSREMLKLMSDPVWHAHLSERSRERGREYNWRKTWQQIDKGLDAG